MTLHTEWVARTTRGDSNRQIAERAHISDATLGRQLRSGSLDPTLIIKIAEAYSESPVIALVDLGFMSSKWITEPGVVTALSRASDEELTDELLRRLRLLDVAPVDDLAARRATAHDGTLRDWDDEQEHAADSSPDEDALREEHGASPID